MDCGTNLKLACDVDGSPMTNELPTDSNDGYETAA